MRPTETDGSSTSGTHVDYTSWMDVGTRILLCRSPLLLASIGYGIDSCYILGSVSLVLAFVSYFWEPHRLTCFCWRIDLSKLTKYEQILYS